MRAKPRPNQLRLRFYIGAALEDAAPEYLTSQNILDKLRDFDKSRSALRASTTCNSISNLLRGCGGIERDYIRQSDHAKQGLVSKFRMNDWEAYRDWLGLAETKWRQVENLFQDARKVGE